MLSHANLMANVQQCGYFFSGLRAGSTLEEAEQVAANLKLLQQYGIVVKLNIVDKVYTSRIWLTVFGPRPRTTAHLARKRDLTLC